ncbi:helix-turn-helix domain-containing protein [Natrialbaceae archaeon A-arb3/5]
MPLEFSSSDESPDLDAVISALNDEDCRQIISILEEPMTVHEIADKADLPLSSAYRKLDRLTEATLVSETAGGRRGRHQKSRYVTDFDRIAIALTNDRELDLDIEQSPGHSFRF